MASLPKLQIHQTRQLDKNSPNGINKKPQPAKARLRSQPYEQWPEWLSVLEAADVLCVGRNQLYNALHRGEIEHRHFGHTIRIPKAALRPKGE